MEDDDSDAEIERANARYQASREASRERQRREREQKRKGSGDSVSQPPSKAASSAGTPAPEVASAPSVGLSALGIDRAQLERERLARQAKRSQSGSSQPEAGPSQPKQPRSSNPGNPGSHTTSARLPNHPLQSKGPFPTDAAGEYYLDGELRHVALQIGNPTTERTFSPQNVFGKVSSTRGGADRQRDQISLVITSSFCWDPEWIESFMPLPEDCPTIRVLRPPVHHDGEYRQMRGKLRPLGNGEIQVYPAMEGRFG